MKEDVPVVKSLAENEEEVPVVQVKPEKKAKEGSKKKDGGD